MIKIVQRKITLSELKKTARETFGNLVKATVDVEKEIIAVYGELHADQEALLIEKGSKQENLWGINIYLEQKGNSRIEFDSMINLRPSQGNMSRGVEDKNTRQKITKIVSKIIKE